MECAGRDGTGPIVGFCGGSNKYWNRKSMEFFDQLVNYEYLKVRFSTPQLAS